MKSIEWIDRLIKEKNLPSDRQAALMLGMTVGSMSNHRQGKSVTLDDRYAYRIEELLDLPHGSIIADQHAEREKDPAMRAVWRNMGKLVAGGAIAGVAMLVCQLGYDAKPAQNNEISLLKSTTYSIFTLVIIIQKRLSALFAQIPTRAYA